MRVDKLTTKFRESLEQAQSLALGSDHAYIEPPHLVLAMLDQQDGQRALLERAGVQIDALHGYPSGIERQNAAPDFFLWRV